MFHVTLIVNLLILSSKTLPESDKVHFVDPLVVIFRNLSANVHNSVLTAPNPSSGIDA